MLLLCAGLSFGEDSVETTVIAGGAELDSNRIYLWRGADLTAGPTVNPSGYLDVGAFEVWAWGNVRVAPKDGVAFDEIDVGATWAGEAGPVSITPSLTSYHLIETGYSATVEATVEVSIPVAGPFSAVTRQTLDILDNPKGYYGELGVGMTDEEEVLAAELTVAAGNDLNNQYLYGLYGFAPLLVDLHGSYYLYLTDSVYLKPHATVVYRLPALAALSESPVGWNAGLAAGWGI